MSYPCELKSSPVCLVPVLASLCSHQSSVEELWKGREDISDREARIEVIAALKEMIRAWLDENHPEIDVPERLRMAERMDITLIERQKAESMKTLFELSQAIRLSFIEMQFMKKVCTDRISLFLLLPQTCSRSYIFLCTIGNGECIVHDGRHDDQE